MARLRTAFPSVALVFVAAAFAGCGGGEDASSAVTAQDRTALEGVTEEITRSAADRDAVRFCAVVQPSLVKDAFGGRRGCLRVIRRALRDNSEVLGELDIERITVKDDGAIVTYAQDPPGDVLFVREQGEWYLALNELALQRQGATGETGPRGDG